MSCSWVIIIGSVVITNPCISTTASDALQYQHHHSGPPFHSLHEHARAHPPTHTLSLLSSYKILNLDYLTYILKISNLTTFNTQLSLFHHFQESQNCTVYNWFIYGKSYTTLSHVTKSKIFYLLMSNDSLY